MFDNFGITQGRLVVPYNDELQCFPNTSWQSEFLIAQEIGIEFIELMFDEEYNNKNPLFYKNGDKDIIDILNKSNQEVYSICFNYMITHSILENKQTMTLLKSLFNLRKKVKYKMLVLPFYGLSCMTNENIYMYKECLESLSTLCKQNNIYLAIEADVDALFLSKFIADIGNKNIGVVYDTGNRVAQNVDLSDEILLLGNKILHVHIKDKNKENENVLIGTGLVDFYSVFKALKRVKYNRKFVFESQRGLIPSKTAYSQAMYINFIKNEAELEES